MLELLRVSLNTLDTEQPALVVRDFFLAQFRHPRIRQTASHPEIQQAVSMLGLTMEEFESLFTQNSKSPKWQTESLEETAEGAGIERRYKIIHALNGEALLTFPPKCSIYLTPNSLALIPAGTDYRLASLEKGFRFRYYV